MHLLDQHADCRRTLLQQICIWDHVPHTSPASWETKPRVPDFPHKKKSEFWRTRHKSAVILWFFLDLALAGCIFSIQYIGIFNNMELRRTEFHSIFLSCMLFNLQKLTFLCYFCFPTLPLPVLYILKGLRQTFFIIVFWWWQTCYALIPAGDCNANSISGDVQGNQNHSF